MTGASPSPSPNTGFAPGPLLADLAGMVRFYSRIPVPRLSADDDPAAMPVFGRAIRMLPVAALLIALPAALTVFLLGSTGLPTLAVAGLGLAVAWATTGGLHEDGLADMADGFGGGASPERKLEIMKDSRIGSYGAAALALALLVRASLIAGVLETAGPLGAALAWLGAASVSRTFALLVWSRLPPARADGASNAAGRPEAGVVPGTLWGAALIGLVLAAPHSGTIGVVVGLGLALGAVLALSALARRQIGGQTGDVIGAGQQVAEIGFLVGLTAV